MKFKQFSKIKNKFGELEMFRNFVALRRIKSSKIQYDFSCPSYVKFEDKKVF